MKALWLLSVFVLAAAPNLCSADGVSVTVEQTISNARNLGLSELQTFKEVVASSQPRIVDGKEMKNDSFNLSHSSLFILGSGLQALSINLGNGAIGYLESISPVSLTCNFWERVLVHWKLSESGWENEVYRFTFFPQTLGVTLSRQPTGLILGVSYIPLQIRINDIQIGCGIEWRAFATATFDPDSFSLIVPFSYLIPL